MNQKGLYVNFGRATPRYVQHHKHTLLPPSGQTVHVPRVQVQVLSNSLQTVRFSEAAYFCQNEGKHMERVGRNAS